MVHHTFIFCKSTTDHFSLLGTGAAVITGLVLKQLQGLLFCFLGQKTGGNGLILPGQKEEMESRIRLSRWKVDTRINLVDPFQGGSVWTLSKVLGFGGPFPRWVWRTLSGFGGLFPRVPHIIYIIHLPFLNWNL